MKINIKKMKIMRIGSGKDRTVKLSIHCAPLKNTPKNFSKNLL